MWQTSRRRTYQRSRFKLLGDWDGLFAASVNLLIKDLKPVGHKPLDLEFLVDLSGRFQ